MSYRCAVSGEVVPAGQSAIRLVLAVRPAIYPMGENACKKRVPGLTKKQRATDPGGQGFQIAREVFVCEKVAARFRDQEPEAWGEQAARASRPLEIQNILEGPLGRDAPMGGHSARG